MTRKIKYIWLHIQACGWVMRDREWLGHAWYRFDELWKTSELYINYLGARNDLEKP